MTANITNYIPFPFLLGKFILQATTVSRIINTYPLLLANTIPASVIIAVNNPNASIMFKCLINE